MIRIEVEARRRLSRLDVEFYARYHRSFDLVRETNRRAVAARKPPREEWLLGILACHHERLRATNLGFTCTVVTRALDGAMDYAVEQRPELLESEAFQQEVAALLGGLLEAQPG